jgi:hypothetical protein
VANVQIKLSIREEVLQQLEATLEEFPEARTTNLIACGVIEDYLPLWAEAERYRRKKVARQHAKVREELGITKRAKRSSKGKGKKASKASKGSSKRSSKGSKRSSKGRR